MRKLPGHSCSGTLLGAPAEEPLPKSSDKRSPSAEPLPDAAEKLPAINQAVTTLIECIEGGASRQETVFLALKYLSLLAPRPDYVLVHDAARPFLNSTLLDKVIQAVVEREACTLAVPVSDTVKRRSEDTLGDTVDRSELVLIQTPQAARYDWLLEAHLKAREQGLNLTDDSAILQLAGHPVYIVEGSPFNLKLTNPGDLDLFRALSLVLLAKL